MFGLITDFPLSMKDRVMRDGLCFFTLKNKVLL